MVLNWLLSWGGVPQGTRATDSAPSVAEERRLWPRHPCDVPVNIRVVHPPDGRCLSARARDVSAGGIGLRVSQLLPPGTVLAVQLPGPGRSEVRACVVHITPKPDGDCMIGCAFIAQLTDDDLELFGAGRCTTGPSDRRQWERFSCAAAARFRILRSAQTEWEEAEVADISPGGVGLLIGRPVPVGTVLRLELQPPARKSGPRLLACVARIVTKQDGRWALGCRFIREIGAEELRRFNARSD